MSREKEDLLMYSSWDMRYELEMCCKFLPELGKKLNRVHIRCHQMWSGWDGASNVRAMET